MARTNNKRGGLKGFITLIAIVSILGAILWSQGDLISPVQSTTMLASMASGEEGFAMVGECGVPPDASVSAEDTSSSETVTGVEASTVTETTTQDTEAVETGTMTMDEFVAELTAAGVDVDAVTATMSAEGRSLDNLLAVVNSGRTTVADLAARLSNSSTESSTSTETASTEPAEGGSTSLIDFRWDELGSVAYNLWFMLAITVFVIVVGRPIGWLINRLKRASATNT